MKNDQSLKIDHLIHTKQYEELSQEDKLLVDEHLGGKKSFEHYQLLFRESHATQERPVSRSVANNLSTRFKQKNRPVWYSLFNYRIPAYVSMMLITLMMTASWWWTTRHPNMIEVTKEVYLPGKTDTLLVELPPDTIVIEKVIQQTIPVYITSNVPVEKTQETTEGSSLAEQQDLTEFLVSGR